MANTLAEATYRLAREVSENMKRCPRCGELKPFSEFHRSRANRDGLFGYCKPCKIAYNTDSVRKNMPAFMRRLRRYWQTPTGKAMRRAAVRNRRARLPGPIGWTDLELLYDAHDRRCVYCGKKCDPTMDHFVPLDLGGPHEISNIVHACSSCNSHKIYKHPSVFLSPLRYVEIVTRKKLADAFQYLI